MAPRTLLAFLLALCLFVPGTLRATDTIEPPFGLAWGTTKDRLATLLQGAKAKVVQKRVVGGRDAWDVEGLIQTHLRQTVFFFRNDGLVEVELQYQNNAWLDSDYNTFMGQLRMSLENKFGPGKLIARSKNPQGDVMQTITGYEWVQPSNAVQLIYFSAESPSQVFRMVSLHYKSL
ncbi:MAG: hypothetical protein NTZ46_04770 [Verrucomicrobia bacterium]|nr:hypothetical protein [Verrucomicrobiota bacterium]